MSIPLPVEITLVGFDGVSGSENGNALDFCQFLKLSKDARKDTEN